MRYDDGDEMVPKLDPHGSMDQPNLQPITDKVTAVCTMHYNIVPCTMHYNTARCTMHYNTAVCTMLYNIAP